MNEKIRNQHFPSNVYIYSIFKVLFLIVTTISFPIPNLSNIFSIFCNFFAKIIPLEKDLEGRRPISFANKNISGYEKVTELVNSTTEVNKKYSN